MLNPAVRLCAALNIFVALTFCSPALPAAGPERMVVRDLVGKAPVSQDKADVITTLMIARIQEAGQYRIYSREEIQQVLDQAGDATKLGADCDTTRCILDFGAAMNADRVISGSIGKLGSQYVVTLSLYNIVKGEREATLTKTCGCTEDDLVTVVPGYALELLGIEPPERRAAREMAARVAGLLERAKAAESRGQMREPSGESALDFYRESRQLDPQNAEAQRGLERVRDYFIAQGDRELQANRFPEAETAFRHALEVFPQDGMASARLAEASRRKDEAAAEKAKSQEQLTKPARKAVIPLPGF